MDEHITITKEEWDSLKQDVKDLKDSVDALLTLWNQGKAIVVFVKYAAAIVGGFGSLYLFLRMLFTGKGF